MAHWSWVEADNHIEFAYDKAGIAVSDREPSAIALQAYPQESLLLEGYAHKDNILGRLAELATEHGIQPRVELVFEMAPIIEGNAN